MNNPPCSAAEICFGLNLELDRSSFSCFLQLAGRKEMADTLASRLNEMEIELFVDQFTGLLRKHLSKDEYHRLFLLDDQSHHQRETEE